MKRLKYLLLFLILAIIITFCSVFKSNFQETSSDSTVRIGTFNIEWLGDGVNDTKDRTEEDYKLIADVILDTKLDIIGLQEIENINALNRVLTYLPNFKGYVLEVSGRQNLGVLYKDDIRIDTMYGYMPIAINPSRNRPGFVVHARKGNFDWIMMVVHFKATSPFDSTEELRQASVLTRQKQAETLTHWIDSVLKYSKEQDLIIVGDFNDNPTRQEKTGLFPLRSNRNITFLTENERSCKNEKWDNIDHIVVTNSAKKRVLLETLFIDNLYLKYDKETAKRISDHCPVGVAFEIKSPDND